MILTGDGLSTEVFFLWCMNLKKKCILYHLFVEGRTHENKLKTELDVKFLSLYPIMQSLEEDGYVVKEDSYYELTSYSVSVLSASSSESGSP